MAGLPPLPSGMPPQMPADITLPPLPPGMPPHYAPAELPDFAGLNLEEKDSMEDFMNSPAFDQTWSIHVRLNRRPGQNYIINDGYASLPASAMGDHRIDVLVYSLTAEGLDGVDVPATHPHQTQLAQIRCRGSRDTAGNVPHLVEAIGATDPNGGTIWVQLELWWMPDLTQEEQEAQEEDSGLGVVSDEGMEYTLCQANIDLQLDTFQPPL